MSLPKPYYEEPGITIYHGDCREILPHLPKVDLVLTDPPYGIGASSGVGKYGIKKWGGSKDLKWDEAIPTREAFDIVLASGSLQIIWGMNYFQLPATRKYLVWDKGAGFRQRTFAECELAWCSWDGNSEIYTRDPLACRDYKGKDHPTQKPIELFKWCIDIAGAAKTILDPFMGSGTTLRAAKDLGRQAIGIEIEEKYCEIAVNRLRQEVLPL